MKTDLCSLSWVVQLKVGKVGDVTVRDSLLLRRLRRLRRLRTLP
jgi:hypothetical protein